MINLHEITELLIEFAKLDYRLNKSFPNSPYRVERKTTRYFGTVRDDRYMAIVQIEPEIKRVIDIDFGNPLFKNEIKYGDFFTNAKGFRLRG